MDLDKLHKELENLANTVKVIIQNSMDKYDDLQNSNIYNDMHGDVVGLDLIKFFIHEYYWYIEHGAAYKAKKPPLDAIIEWCRTAGINPSNGTAYAIQMAIFKRGLTARPFFEEAWDKVDDLFDGFADRVMEILLEDIDAELS